MLKEKGALGVVVALLAVLLVVGMVVTSVQGKGDNAIGTVNMEAVFTQHMAPPLFEARDAMQNDFDGRADEMTDEEKNQVFLEYQAQLELLEMEFAGDIDEAIEIVAKANGFDVMLDSAAVLHGGQDMTEAVLEVLK